MVAMTADPAVDAWSPAQAARRLAEGALPPVEEPHPRIERALTALRATTVLADPEQWDQATADRVTILCAHFGVSRGFFSDPALAYEQLGDDDRADALLAEVMRRHGIQGYRMCGTGPLTRSQHRAHLWTLLNAVIADEASEASTNDNQQSAGHQP